MAVGLEPDSVHSFPFLGDDFHNVIQLPLSSQISLFLLQVRVQLRGVVVEDGPLVAPQVAKLLIEDAYVISLVGSDIFLSFFEFFLESFVDLDLLLLFELLFLGGLSVRELLLPDPLSFSLALVGDLVLQLQLLLHISLDAKFINLVYLLLTVILRNLFVQVAEPEHLAHLVLDTLFVFISLRQGVVHWGIQIFFREEDWFFDQLLHSVYFVLVLPVGIVPKIALFLDWVELPSPRIDCVVVCVWDWLL